MSKKNIVYIKIHMRRINGKVEKESERETKMLLMKQCFERCFSSFSLLVGIVFLFIAWAQVSKWHAYEPKR